MRHINDQMPGKRGYRNKYQELHRQPVGLEVDADHCAKLKIDEQQKNILECGIALFHHVQVFISCRPDNRGADNKQCQIMKNIYQYVTNTLNFFSFNSLETPLSFS